MERIFTLIYEGRKIVCYAGVARLREIYPEGNFMEMMVARQPRQTQDMKRHNDKKGPIDAPLAELDPDTIQVDGSFIVGKGVVEVDGVHYGITINPTSVDWVNLDEPEPSTVCDMSEESQKKAIEDLYEMTHSTAEQVQEDVKETEETSVIADEPKVPENFMQSPVTEEVVPTTIEERPLDDNHDSTPGVSMMTHHATVSEGFMNKPIEDKPVENFSEPTDKRKFTGVGMTIGSLKGTPSNLILGHTRRNVSGITLNGNMPEPNTTEDYRSRALKRPFNRTFMQDEAQSRVPWRPRPIRQQEPVLSEEEQLMAKWQEKKNAQLNRFEQPVSYERQYEPVDELEASIPKQESVVTAEPVMSEADAKKKRKEELRASMSPAVASVIGNIPLECLCSISEFTSRPVDKAALDRDGDMFCIDNRWHRQGKWFCIDVVSNGSRYFFNSRLNVSIEIPVADCKAWYEAVQ